MVIGKYIRTIRYLQFKQIFYLLIRKTGLLNFTLKIDQSKISIRSTKRRWETWIPRKSFFSAPQTFHFLNQSAAIDFNNGWYSTQNKLWRYNLHYFDYLLTLNSVVAQTLLDNWIENNPVNKHIAWDPYPLSLRIVNWIKWALQGNTLTLLQLQSLITQTIYLSKNIEYHLQANHLFENAKALVFAGLFFDSEFGDKFFKKGKSILEEEINKQILDDGAHYELSPMYHAIILEGLLDILQLVVIYQKSFPADWYGKIQQMFIWLKKMTHPDGGPAFFNDTTNEVAPTLLELKNYAEFLGINLEQNDIFCDEKLTESGYVRFIRGKAHLFIDVANVKADYQPGHTHADSLSFEFSYDKERIFVNSGISTYWDNSLRAWQRSTKAHNALVLHDQNSSEVWSNFRLGRRARIIDPKIELKELGRFSASAGHDGYNIKGIRALVFRKFTFEAGLLQIEDKIVGKYNNEIKIYFHLHPAIKIISALNNVFTFQIENGQIVCFFPKEAKLDVIKSYYYPAFNYSEPNKTIVLSFTKSSENNSFIANTLIKWEES